jgi:hypothetical protein
LLAIVLWNLAIYVLLAASLGVSWRHSKAGSQPRPQHPPFAALRRSLDGLRQWRRRSGKVHAEVAARFYVRWHAITASLDAQRWRRVLHLCAAMWGMGVAASLFMRGLVVEYRVGWESTFLDAGQVHAILSVLFMPVAALFSHAPFTVEEVARLRFGAGDGAVAGARWVYMYGGLLLLVVALPRLVLAALAFRREKALAHAVAIDLQEPYYQRLIAALSPTQVQLCVSASHSEDQAALLSLLLQEAGASSPAWAQARLGTTVTTISTPGGDRLGVAGMPQIGDPARLPAALNARPGWIQKTLGRAARPWASGAGHAGDAQAAQTLHTLREHSDVILHVVRSAEELQAAVALLQWWAKPGLVVLRLPGAVPAQVQEVLAQCRTLAQQIPLVAEVLSFDAFARCWIQDEVLLDAIGRCLPAAQRQGYARLSSAWTTRNLTRLHGAMAALGHHVALAARQREEVRSPPLSLKSLVSPAEREAGERSQKAAMLAVVERLQRSEAQTTTRLLSLYRIDAAAAGALEHRLEEKFVVRAAVNTPQAGMAGAATGAAMGASVDLLTGGLTLGAAAALGALVGGSAAFVAAAWKNKATPAGTTAVQLSDEMLQAIVEAGLLRYLAIVHWGRSDAGSEGSDSGARMNEPQLFWKSEVVAAVEAHRDRLAPLWADARAAQKAAGQAVDPASDAAAEPASALVSTLETIALKLLRNLHTRA